MSVNCEPSELTPLRRSHLRRQQQQQQPQSYQQQPTTSTDYVSMSTEYNTSNNNNNTNNNNNNNTSDSDLSDSNRFNVTAMGDTARVITRVTIDVVILSIGESLNYLNYIIIVFELIKYVK